MQFWVDKVIPLTLRLADSTQGHPILIDGTWKCGKCSEGLEFSHEDGKCYAPDPCQSGKA